MQKFNPSVFVFHKVRRLPMKISHFRQSSGLNAFHDDVIGLLVSAARIVKRNKLRIISRYIKLYYTVLHLFFYTTFVVFPHTYPAGLNWDNSFRGRVISPYIRTCSHPLTALIIWNACTDYMICAFFITRHFWFLDNEFSVYHIPYAGIGNTIKYGKMYFILWGTIY